MLIYTNNFSENELRTIRNALLTEIAETKRYGIFSSKSSEEVLKKVEKMLENSKTDWGLKNE